MEHWNLQYCKHVNLKNFDTVYVGFQLRINKMYIILKYMLNEILL
jgi:hypothetical protein